VCKVREPGRAGSARRHDATTSVRRGVGLGWDQCGAGRFEPIRWLVWWACAACTVSPCKTTFSDARLEPARKATLDMIVEMMRV